MALDTKDITRYLYAIDLTSLEKLWKLYPEKHENASFKNAVSNLKKEITKNVE